MRNPYMTASCNAIAGNSQLVTTIVKGLIIAVLLASTCALTQTVTTIYDFGPRPEDGANPQAGVTFDKFGNLLGTALGGTGSGVVFRLVPSSGGGPWTESLPHKFAGQPTDGSTPVGRLIITPSGRAFGTTLQGGPNNLGTAFVLNPPTTGTGPRKVQVLHSFGGFPGDGENPNAGLLANGDVFYGVTFGGGADGRG